MRLSGAILLALLSASVLAEENGYEVGGHTKFRLIGQSFPDDSAFRSVADANSLDLEGDLRINYSYARERWTFDIAYQLFTLHGDSIEWTRNFAGLDFLPLNRLPNDDGRLFKLTDVIHDQGRSAQVHRLDRLSVRYTSEKAVFRFGRQALSWGNGLFYAPMDLVNPFDPTAIDTEFKVGDDMLYAQYLRDNGDDIESAVVVRRNPLSDDVESGQRTIALKYHGFVGDSEYDVLLAESYGDTVFGIGGAHSIGGAVWRGDLVVTNTSEDTTIQAVSNLSYSWIWGGKNVSGALEYYFNGFGEREYDPLTLAGNTELLTRLARRELFTLGRHYLAGSVVIEMTPLWSLTPTLLANVDDPSALLQLVTQYSLSDNVTFLGSVNIPLGANGTEFGGIEAGLPNTYASTGASLFAQIAWYF